jgi:phosphoserine phosphatase
MLPKALGIVFEGCQFASDRKRDFPLRGAVRRPSRLRASKEVNAKQKARPASLETHGLGESAKNGWGGDATAG